MQTNPEAQKAGPILLKDAPSSAFSSGTPWAWLGCKPQALDGTPVRTHFRPEPAGSRGLQGQQPPCLGLPASREGRCVQDGPPHCPLCSAKLRSTPLLSRRACGSLQPAVPNCNASPALSEPVLPFYDFRSTGRVLAGRDSGLRPPTRPSRGWGGSLAGGSDPSPTHLSGQGLRFPTAFLPVRRPPPAPPKSLRR